MRQYYTALTILQTKADSTPKGALYLEVMFASCRLMNSGEEGDYRLFSLRRDSYLGLGKARQALEDAR